MHVNTPAEDIVTTGSYTEFFMNHCQELISLSVSGWGTVLIAQKSE